MNKISRFVCFALLAFLVSALGAQYLELSPAIFKTPLPAPDSRDVMELIQNGGCEETLVEGNIPDWEEVVATTWTQRSAGPDPYEGSYYFFSGVNASAELRQDVDVSAYADFIDTGTQLFSFSGYVRSWPQSPADLSRIILEYLNFDKSVILTSFDSGDYGDASIWTLISNDTIAPVGTRFIRIRLIATRRSGSNNDGYFDALSLSTPIPLPMAPQNLVIDVVGNDVILDWDPVTHDDLGNPISIDFYEVYSGSVPQFECGLDTLAGTVITPGLTLFGLAGTADHAFFKVVTIAQD